jgi:outer membrane immunogenic protein
VTSRLIATCAIGVAGITAVSAADIPLAAKTAPPAIAASWAGFYLGIHGGHGWGRNGFQEVFTLSSVTEGRFDGLNSSGAVVGGHAGYNWQFGRAVTGLELDFSAADISGHTAMAGVSATQGAFIYTRSDRVKNLGTARARLGWLPTDKVLLYGTAGAAWERFDLSIAQTVNNAFNFSTTETTPSDRLGWVAGAGAEVLLPGSNWIGRLEYLHYDFGSVQPFRSVTSSIPSRAFSDRSGHQTYDIVRAALSYKLGSSPSVDAIRHANAGPVVPAASWAGFYLGAHGGYGWGPGSYTSPLTSAAPFVSIDGPRLRGGVYGGHAGYNWQFDRAAAGVELDFSGPGIGGTSSVTYGTPPSVITVSITDKVDYFGSARARLGWLPLDNALLYGTAGLGWERLDSNTSSVTVTPAGTASSSADTASSRFGWVAGAGVEAKLPGSNWIGRLEYLHYGFGTANVSRLSTTNTSLSRRLAGDHHFDIVRAGLSYRFGDPSAVTPVRYAKAPPMLPAASWAGFYLGAHGGYGWKDNDFTQMVNPQNLAQTGGIKSRGWLAGGHAGYNWQYGRAVAGLEADASLGDLAGRSAAVTGPGGIGGTATDTLEDRVKMLATARARLGWLPADAVLLYATGGLAWERLERTRTTANVNGGFAETEQRRTSLDHFGGVIGAGAEWMPWGPNWVGRLEYLHYDFGKVQDAVTFTSTVPGSLPLFERRGRQTIEVLRAGISYKFGAEQPVVARY